MSLEYFKIALRNLRTRSLRTFLTVLGIIIGVFLVISLISLGRGVTDGIEEQLQMVGGDLIMVMPGEGFDITALIGGMELEDHEINAIKRARGVETVLEMPFTAEMVRHYEKSDSTLLWAVEYEEGMPMLESLMGLEAEKGDLPRPGRREVVAGSLVPQDIFPDLRVGDELVIKGRRFTVSGILRSLGNRQDDLSIMIDLSDFRDVTGIREGSQMAFVEIEDNFSPDVVSENIERGLEDVGRRRADEEMPTYTVVSGEGAADIAGRIMFVLQFAIFAFGSIAVVVGAIGIMNSMFTSVRERTKEIGILKAVGARRKDIISIFLIEAGIIGLVGGVIGVTLGISAALIGEFYLAEAHPLVYIQAHISPALVILGLVFSFVVGCISGFLPARQASRMEPVNALRHE